MSINTFSQDTIIVFANSKNIHQQQVDAYNTKTELAVSKGPIKNVTQLSLQISGKETTARIYKKTVQILDEKNKELATINEDAKNTGTYIFTDKNLIAKICKGFPVLLYLQMNPANDMMAVKSKILFFGKLIMK